MNKIHCKNYKISNSRESAEISKFKKCTRYFRAGKIGDGAYGDVLKVFDENGTAFAAKRFEPDEEDGDGSIESGALREVQEKFHEQNCRVFYRFEEKMIQIL